MRCSLSPGLLCFWREPMLEAVGFRRKDTKLELHPRTIARSDGADQVDRSIPYKLSGVRDERVYEESDRLFLRDLNDQVSLSCVSPLRLTVMEVRSPQAEDLLAREGKAGQRPPVDRVCQHGATHSGGLSRAPFAVPALIILICTHCPGKQGRRIGNILVVFAGSYMARLAIARSYAGFSFFSFDTSSNLRPSASSIAVPPVRFCHRATATST